MNFIGYTYKADVENEKSMLINVLKDLDQITDQQTEPKVTKSSGGSSSSSGNHSYRQ